MSLAAKALPLVFAMVALSGRADAHAHLISAKPAPKDVIAASPTELDLTFSEGLNLAFTGVTVTGPDKAPVAIGAPTLVASKTLLVSIADTLAPGSYTVSWRALAADGHKTSGSYTFTVRP